MSLRLLALLCACLFFAKPAAADGQFILDKSTVISGEPIWLTFRLTNHNAHAIHTYEAIGRGSVQRCEYDFLAHDAAGQVIGLPPQMMIISGPVRAVTIAPGETYQQRLFLPDWFVLQKPGTYTLKCERPVSAGLVIKSDLPLSVLPPDKKALGLVIQTLGRQAQSGSRAAQDEAALSLSVIPDPRIVPPLAALLLRPDPPDQVANAEYDLLEDSRFHAVQGLSRFPGDASAGALLAAMNGDDDELRRAAGDVLKRMHYADHVLPALCREMHFPAAPLRRAAIRAVASLQDPRGFGPLVNALHDPVPAVRVEAAKALGTLGDRRAVPILRAHFQDPDLTLRLACIESLVPLKYPVLSRWLVPIVRSYASPGHEHPAIEAILDLHRDCGDWAALASCLRYDDPRPSRPYNFLLITQMDACHNGSEYGFHWITGGGDTPKALQNNRKILTAIKDDLPVQ